MFGPIDWVEDPPVASQAKAISHPVSTESQRTLLVKTEPKVSRAAGQHDFVVANMFGPVDWADELSLESESKPATPQNPEMVIANMFGPVDWF